MTLFLALLRNALLTVAIIVYVPGKQSAGTVVFLAVAVVIAGSCTDVIARQNAQRAAREETRTRLNMVADNISKGPRR